MTTIKISQLKEATLLNNNDFIAIVQNGETKKIKGNVINEAKSKLKNIEDNGLKTEGFINALKMGIGKDSLYNFETIEGIRDGVTYKEMWILVNAKYNYKDKRFERINYDNFSFGLQLSAEGTYPGEGGIDSINQGFALWKANGKKAYQGNSDFDIEMRNKTNAIIGTVNTDGSITEFGTMLGWQNSYMCDSYGGMTIGGAGFEIDGAGMYPYSRVSLGKFQGGSIDPNRKYTEYGYGYLGHIWNAYHSLFQSDTRKYDSIYFGMEAPMDFDENGDGILDPSSNGCNLDKTRLVFKKLDKSKTHAFENWKEIFSVSNSGEMLLNGKQVASQNTVLTLDVAIVNVTDFNMNYPDDTWNKNNTMFLGAKGINANGDTVSFGAPRVTLTEFGVFGYLGEGYVSAKVIIMKV